MKRIGWLLLGVLIGIAVASGLASAEYLPTEEQVEVAKNLLGSAARPSPDEHGVFIQVGEGFTSGVVAYMVAATDGTTYWILEEWFPL